jgi:hypothetical protein
MSMFEIYNETLRDLLAADKDGTKLEIKQTASGMQVGLVPTHCYPSRHGPKIRVFQTLTLRLFCVRACWRCRLRT